MAWSTSGRSHPLLGCIPPLPSLRLFATPPFLWPGCSFGHEGCGAETTSLPPPSPPAGLDYLCVQSYDGQLLIFECESFAFARFLPSFLVPGPLCYCGQVRGL